MEINRTMKLQLMEHHRDEVHKNRDIQAIFDSMDKMAKEEDPRVIALECEAIARKIASGRPITDKERAFLMKHNPMLYMKAREVAREVEAVKNRIRAARTREEAESVKAGAMNQAMSLSQVDPEAAALMVDAIAQLPVDGKSLDKVEADHQKQLRGLDYRGQWQQEGARIYERNHERYCQTVMKMN